jgi:hypothetical protein
MRPGSAISADIVARERRSARDERSVRALVQNVRRNDAVEPPDVVRDVPPVEQTRPDVAPGVAIRVHAGEEQRILVVVGRDDVEPGGRRRRRHETRTASQLDERPARAVLLEEARREVWPDSQIAQ